MTDNLISVLEEYILSDKKQEVIDSLVPNSQIHLFLKLVHEMKEHGSELPEATKKSLKYFLKKNSGNMLGQKVMFQNLVDKLGRLKEDDSQVSEILSVLNTNFFGFKFEFSKPKTAANSGGKLKAAGEVELFSELSDSFKEARFGEEAILKKVVAPGSPDYWEDVNRLSPYLLRKINFEEFIKNKTVEGCIHLIKTVQDFSFLGDRVLQFAAQFLEKAQASAIEAGIKPEKARPDIPKIFMDNLTLAQIKQLAAHIPQLKQDKQFIKSWLVKRFETAFEGNPNRELDYTEQLALAKEMYDWAKQHVEGDARNLQYQICQLLLNLKIRFNDYDQKLFLEYLRRPPHINSSLFTKEHKQSFKDDQSVVQESFWTNMIRLDINTPYTLQFLVPHYLNHFFAQGAAKETFAEYVHSALLKKEFYTARLLAGHSDMQEITDYFTESQIYNLREKKQLRFVQDSKKRFRHGEAVEVTLEVKNIPNLSIKVFEIATENYYRKKRQRISSTLNVSGLVPAEQRMEVINEKPLKCVRRTFRLDSIEKVERGIFVVEFVGGGLSSRAVIRKGALSCVRVLEEDGIAIYIVDENKDICVPQKPAEQPEGAQDETGGEEGQSDNNSASTAEKKAKFFKTGLFLDSKFYAANQETGRILLPYGAIQRTVDFVLVHQQFAELTSMQLPNDQIELSLHTLFNEESLQTGQKVSFILQPRLYKARKRMPLNLIKNKKVKISSQSRAGVSNVMVYDSLAVSEDNDIVLDYLIPSKTTQIKIELTGAVFKQSASEDSPVSCYNQIYISRNENKNSFFDVFYDLGEENNHIFKVLGKNGEAVENIKVKFRLQSSHFKPGKIVETTLQTDAQGCIKLGDLSKTGIYRLTVQILDADVHPGPFEFDLLKNSDLAALDSSYDIAVNEDLILPATTLEVTQENYSLQRVDTLETQVFSNDFDKISLEDGLLYISGLSKGHYRFCYLEGAGEPLRIMIHVHEGERWSASDDYLIKKNAIIKLSCNQKYLALKNFQKTNQEISFQVLSNQTDSVKVHALAFNYFPKNLTSFLENQSSSEVEEKPQIYKIQQNSTDYLSEKVLSDELNYVVDRKLKKTFMGITLDKPSGLLKRRCVRKTAKGAVGMNSKGQYSHRMEHQTWAQASIPTPMKTAGCANLKLNGLLNEFLGNKGWTQTNIVPDVDGIVNFNFSNAKDCGCLLVVVEDGAGFLVKLLPLNVAGDRELSDTRLPKSRDPSKVYVYERFVYKASEGTEVVLKDVSNTEMSFVDDLPTMFDVLRALNSGGQPRASFEAMEFLVRWNKLEENEQLLKYDSYSSNELNLFLYFKDPEFFENVVRPHISNKAKKSLVDSFLLGELTELEGYLRSFKLNDLTVLEKVLLIAALKNSHPEACEGIIRHTELVLGTTKNKSTQYKRLFDTVINSEKAKDGSLVDSAHSLLGRGQGSLISAPGSGPSSRNRRGNARSANLIDFDQPSSQQRVRKDGVIGVQARKVKPVSMNGFAESSTLLNLSIFGSSATANTESESRNRIRAQAAGSGKGGKGYRPEYQPPVKQRKFKAVGVTKEYAESQGLQDGSEIQVTEFWLDLMKHLLKHSILNFQRDQPDEMEQKEVKGNNFKPFLSENFIYSVSSLVELLAVLTFTSLPFEKAEHDTDSKTEPNTLKLVFGGNSMLFCKQIQERENERLPLDINITQSFFDPLDSHTIGKDGYTRTLNTVTEFVKQRVYQSRVSFTNTSDTDQEVQVVTEIPEGAVPMLGLDYLVNSSYKIRALKTEVLNFNFYFPASGEFDYYPASVTKEGFLVASAPKRVLRLRVVDRLQKKELNTITEIMSLGGKEDILGFLEKQNILNQNIFDFKNIYWLLKDKEFYRGVVRVLKSRLIFEPRVWSFSVFHNDLEVFKEVLEYWLEIRAENQGYLHLDTSFLQFDRFDFKEYSPMINPRVHDSGGFKQNILNKEFKQTYFGFLDYASSKKQLDSLDYLYLCIYLLLQDRITEIVEIFGKIKREDLAGKGLQINYDYLSAYLDLFTDYPEFKVARRVCEEYIDYPVYSWRNKFIDLANQIAEFDGEVGIEKMMQQGARKGDQADKASQEEYLHTVLKENVVEVRTKNLGTATVEYFKIDLETMFTEDPFKQVDMSDFSYVKPHFSQQFEVEQKADTDDYDLTRFEVPEHLRSSNLVIQVSAGAKVNGMSYFPAKMKVFVLEGLGQVKIKQGERPLSQVYVKCFARYRGQRNAKFHKDGYTDLRGTFDYASLNLDSVTNIEKFAILVVSSEFGGLTKNVEPPKELRGDSGSVKPLNLFSDNWAKKQKAKFKSKKKYAGKKAYYPMKKAAVEYYGDVEDVD